MRLYIYPVYIFLLSETSRRYAPTLRSVFFHAANTLLMQVNVLTISSSLQVSLVSPSRNKCYANINNVNNNLSRLSRGNFSSSAFSETSFNRKRNFVQRDVDTFKYSEGTKRKNFCLKRFPEYSESFRRRNSDADEMRGKVTALFLTRDIRQCQDFANRRLNFPTKWTWKPRLHFAYSFCLYLNSWIRARIVAWYAVCRHLERETSKRYSLREASARSENFQPARTAIPRSICRTLQPIAPKIPFLLGGLYIFYPRHHI